MYVEQVMERALAGETEVLGENQAQCHFIDHKSHKTWLGKLTNCLRQGMALPQ
jgi:hypothetical protein